MQKKKSQISPPKQAFNQGQKNTRFFQNGTERNTPFFEVGQKMAPHRDLGLSGRGNPGNAVNFGDVSPVQLRGRTNADFSNNRWALVNERGVQGAGCEGCTGGHCVQYSATVRSTFQVATTVALPNIADYSSYTTCQQQRIREAITNVLAPHEQEHVRAFRSYNGTVNTPISMTGCRSALEGMVASRAEAIHLGVEAPRRASAQAASDALDPFVVNVDLNCT